MRGSEGREPTILPRQLGASPDPGASENSMPEHTAPPQKCPYLAGRPPHGSHHLEPSGVNVCYARTREAKPYSRVSQETQTTRCFRGGEVYERCADFESARERRLALPVFDGKIPAADASAGTEAPRREIRRERMKRRRRAPLRAQLAILSQSRFACVCWLLLMAAAFWLMRRSM